MSKQSKVIIGYIKDLTAVNSGFEAVLAKIRLMAPEKAERYLGRFHGMTMGEFMMAVGA